jgi:hypothetical protein
LKLFNSGPAATYTSTHNIPKSPRNSFTSSQILLYIQTGDLPQEDVAKFGYGPDMKVKKKLRMHLYFS